MGELTRPILLVTLAPPQEVRSRSTSPNSTSSSTKQLRGIKLFRAITKRLSRKTSREQDDESNDSSSSSSSSSECPEGHSDSGSGNNSPDSMGSTDSALRRVFNSLNLKTSSSRRRSDTSTSSSKKKSSAPATPTKKILRQPIAYTYIRGMSGLPTIRVPRTTDCCAQSCCRCHGPGCGR